MPEEPSLEREAITFQTNGEWSVGELSIALRCIRANYLLLLAVLALGKAADEAIEREFGAERDRPGAFRASLWSAFFVGNMQSFLEELPLVVGPSQDLIVQRIAMGSLGEISLKGLGEPLHQLRELIKDLWYRNRQEKELGELRLLQERVALLGRLGVPPEAARAATTALLRNFRDLKALQDSGKLLLSDDPPSGKRPTRKIKL